MLLRAARVNSTPRTEAATMASCGRGLSRLTARAHHAFDRAWQFVPYVVLEAPMAVASLEDSVSLANELRRSSRNNGFPSAPFLTASMTWSGATSPRSALASSFSTPSASGLSSMRHTVRPASAEREASSAVTPVAGSGRRVSTKSSGPSLLNVNNCSVSRKDVGSAQWRSSRTTTVGPCTSRRETRPRNAAKLACWSGSGPRLAAAGPSPEA